MNKKIQVATATSKFDIETDDVSQAVLEESKTLSGQGRKQCLHEFLDNTG